MKNLILLFCFLSCSVFSKEQVSQASHGQENWLIEKVFNHKKNGYFIELAAADGITCSNTYRLEREFGWEGICIEANPSYYNKLINNRNCTVVQACIDDVNHEIKFAPIGLMGGILSGDTRVNLDNKNRKRALRNLIKKNRIMTMQTKTLEQVLDESEAPSVIDFLSLDIEGAEYRALKNFPFEKYTFLAMCIELPSKELSELLNSHGYIPIKKIVLDTLFVHESIENLEEIKAKTIE